MKPVYYLSFLLLLLFACKQLAYVSTDKGGCNDMGEKQLAAKRSLESKPDSVYYTISEDTLSIHVGINYICCAPFTTSASIEQNLISMEVIDTCSPPTFNCYCRCMCYYTFDFNFNDFEAKEYQYELYLKEARTPTPKLIDKGVINRN